MTKVTKQLAGIQDLLLGTQDAVQERGGQTVLVTGVSGATIPFDEHTGKTIAEHVTDEIAAIPDIKGWYDNGPGLELHDHTFSIKFGSGMQEVPRGNHTHTVETIDAQGEPNNTKYLRGDGVWATPPGALISGFTHNLLVERPDGWYVGAELPEYAPAEAGKLLQVKAGGILSWEDVTDSIRDALNYQADKAENAANQAEIARDAAFINADVYPDVGTGLAAVADGEQFQVVEGDEIVRYRRDSASSQTKVARYPRANSVFQPSWAQNYNLWPFPTFTGIPDNFLMLERERFRYTPIDYVDGLTPFPQGKSIRVDTSKIGSLRSPRAVIYPDEVGITEGDTISLNSVASVISSEGAGTLRLTVVAYSSRGDNIGYKSSVVAQLTDSGPQSLDQALEFELPAGLDHLGVFLESIGSDSVFLWHALWVHKSISTKTPGWPSSQVHPFFEQESYRVEQDKIAEAIAESADSLEYLVVRREEVTFDSETITLSANNPRVDTRYTEMTGWGEKYSPAGIEFNAVRVLVMGRNPGIAESNYWAKLSVVVRTGTNSQLDTGTIVAVGSVAVVPNEEVLRDVTVMLGDPDSGELITLSDADFMGGEYFIGVMVDGKVGPAFCSPHLAEQSNSLGQSYYTTRVTEAFSRGFLPWTSNGRVGVDHLLLESPTYINKATPTQEFIEDIKKEIDVPPVVREVELSYWGKWNLRNYSAKLAGSSNFTLALIGDSWTNGSHRLYTPLRDYFESKIGALTGGYSSANPNAVPPFGVARNISTGWSIGDTLGLDANPSMVSTAAGDTLRFTADSTSKVIHYRQHVESSNFTYSIGGGSPITVEAAGPDEYVALEIIGDGSLLLTAEGPGVEIFGCDVRASGEKILLQKLGRGGARASTFESIDEEVFQVGYESIMPDVVAIALGTNDNSGNVSPLLFKSQVENIADRVLSVNPLCDVLLIGAGPNGLNRQYSIDQYNEQLFLLAQERSWGFVDLKKWLGEYEQANTRGLYSDDVHPNADGGRVISRAITQVLGVE